MSIPEQQEKNQIAVVKYKSKQLQATA